MKRIFPQFDIHRQKEFETFLLKLALQRQENVAEDTPLVQLFFETLSDLIDKGEELNHSANDDFIAVNLTEYFTACGKKQIRYFDDIQQLRRELKNSTYFQFRKANQSVYSQIIQRTIRCWVFKKP